MDEESQGKLIDYLGGQVLNLEKIIRELREANYQLSEEGVRLRGKVETLRDLLRRARDEQT